jgi:hypothetical protein
MSLHTSGVRMLVTPAVLAVALAGLTGGAAQAAGKPDIQKTPAGEVSTVSEGSCTFPVRADVRARQSMTKVFFDSAGQPRTIHVSGAFTGTLTHVLPDGSDGPSIRVNFSGPGNFDPATGILSAKGPWLLEGPDDPNTPAFDGVLVLARGQSQVSADPVTGVLTVTGGNVTDLCALLA